MKTKLFGNSFFWTLFCTVFFSMNVHSVIFYGDGGIEFTPHDRDPNNGKTYMYGYMHGTAETDGNSGIFLNYGVLWVHPGLASWTYTYPCAYSPTVALEWVIPVVNFFDLIGYLIIAPDNNMTNTCFITSRNISLIGNTYLYIPNEIQLSNVKGATVMSVNPWAEDNYGKPSAAIPYSIRPVSEASLVNYMVSSKYKVRVELSNLGDQGAWLLLAPAGNNLVFDDQYGHTWSFEIGSNFPGNNRGCNLISYDSYNHYTVPYPSSSGDSPIRNSYVDVPIDRYYDNPVPVDIPVPNYYFKDTIIYDTVHIPKYYFVDVTDTVFRPNVVLYDSFVPIRVPKLFVDTVKTIIHVTDTTYHSVIKIDTQYVSLLHVDTTAAPSASLFYEVSGKSCIVTLDSVVPDGHTLSYSVIPLDEDWDVQLSVPSASRRGVKVQHILLREHALLLENSLYAISNDNSTAYFTVLPVYQSTLSIQAAGKIYNSISKVYNIQGHYLGLWSDRSRIIRRPGIYIIYDAAKRSAAKIHIDNLNF